MLPITAQSVLVTYRVLLWLRLVAVVRSRYRVKEYWYRLRSSKPHMITPPNYLCFEYLPAAQSNA